MSKRRKNTAPKALGARRRQTTFLLEQEILGAKPGFLGKLVRRPTVLGVYSPFPDNKLLWTARTEAGLLRKLRKLDQEGVVWPLLVIAAGSKSELPPICWTPGDRDEYTQRRRAFYTSLAQFIQDKGRQLSEDFKDQVLDDFVGMPKGELVGRRPRPEANRRIIELMREQLSGKNLKELAPSEADPVRWAKQTKTEERRFCLRAYRVWKELEFPSWRHWRLADFAPGFLAECGFQFPKDMPVAREAVERGRKHRRRPPGKQRGARSTV